MSLLTAALQLREGGEPKRAFGAGPTQSGGKSRLLAPKFTEYVPIVPVDS